MLPDRRSVASHFSPRLQGWDCFYLMSTSKELGQVAGKGLHLCSKSSRASFYYASSAPSCLAIATTMTRPTGLPSDSECSNHERFIAIRLETHGRETQARYQPSFYSAGSERVGFYVLVKFEDVVDSTYQLSLNGQGFSEYMVVDRVLSTILQRHCRLSLTSKVISSRTFFSVFHRIS